MSGTINREWIAAELSKGIEAEENLSAEASARADAPPDPELAVLYNEIATADERHREIVEAVATRYGHTPSRNVSGGIGEALTRLKEKVSELGITPLDRISHDLTSKANAVHWYTAWIAAFEAIGETESARELAAVLTEEKAHHDALQHGLNRMVERGRRPENRWATASRRKPRNEPMGSGVPSMFREPRAPGDTLKSPPEVWIWITPLAGRWIALTSHLLRHGEW